MSQYWHHKNAQSIGGNVEAIFTILVCSLLLISHSSSPCCFQKSKVDSSEGEVDEFENCEDTHTEKQAKISTQICWKKKIIKSIIESRISSASVLFLKL